MTTEPERDPVEPDDVRTARAAIDAYRSRTDPPPEQPEVTGGARGTDDRVDDQVAECIAREAWDAVIAVTPPPPDPATDPGPAVEPPEVAERRAQAVAIVRGLRQLGYHLDESLLPGPDMAAG
ncbi:hypothetical protein AB0P15_28805 [Streptomyces sp. NPDC087917]|uniref:hypothetical protein n=1 Tax=Streptomyces sp. NPDC087917 TaxID=3155060 RepID=UPI003427E7A3